MAALSGTTLAVEPLTDRAVITHLNAHLLLPDGSTLSVDMSRDCGRRFENTGIIVTSDSGAQVMAVAYSSLWGHAAGQAIMDTWRTKVKITDPRKPTFIIVAPPKNAAYWTTTSKLAKKRVSSLTLSRRISVMSVDDKATSPPPFSGFCGTRSHNSYGG